MWVNKVAFNIFHSLIPSFSSFTFLFLIGLLSTIYVAWWMSFNRITAIINMYDTKHQTIGRCSNLWMLNNENGATKSPKGQKYIRSHTGFHLIPVMFRYKSKACHGRFSVFDIHLWRHQRPKCQTLFIFKHNIKSGKNNNFELCGCECIRCSNVSNVQMLNICLGCSVCSWCFVLILYPVIWLQNYVQLTCWAFS